MNKVGVIGCGKIFPRHLEAISQSEKFELISVCDTDLEVLRSISSIVTVNAFQDYKEMINTGDINFVVVSTPNSQHFNQALYSLRNGCDVLIEKPATLDPELIDVLIKEATRYSQKIYCVLQVRLNSCIQNIKHLIDNGIIGQIRGISLIQRWQRPKEYFDDWRGEPLIGGGILHECGIHYLDILCYLFGKPKVVSAKKYNTKHKNTTIEDTIYSIIDYGSFGGSVEINISSEPSNLECSLTILTEAGFIKLGGKAMNEMVDFAFSTNEKTAEINLIMNSNNTVGTPNSYGAYAGSCPNHPILYKKIKDFTLQETKNVLYLIKDIYDLCDTDYYKEQEWKN